MISIIMVRRTGIIFEIIVITNIIFETETVKFLIGLSQTGSLIADARRRRIAAVPELIILAVLNNSIQTRRLTILTSLSAIRPE